MAGFPALFIGFDVSVAMDGGKHENHQLKRKQPGRNPAAARRKFPRLSQLDSGVIEQNSESRRSAVVGENLICITAVSPNGGATSQWRV